MRKTFALLTAAVLLLSVFGTACGSASEEGTDGKEEQTAEILETPDGSPDAAAILDAPPSDQSETGGDEKAPDADSQDAEETSSAPEEPDETPTPETTPTPAAVTTPAAAQTLPPAQVQMPQPEPTLKPEPTPEPKPAATREAAMAYIGSSASSMIAAIGAPVSSSYAPSCLGDGEDGELIYDGFTVYTYREGGSETVQDVL